MPSDDGLPLFLLITYKKGHAAIKKSHITIRETFGPNIAKRSIQIRF